MNAQATLAFSAPVLSMQSFTAAFARADTRIKKELEETMELAKNTWRKTVDAMNQLAVSVYLRTLKAEAPLRQPSPADNDNGKGISHGGKIYEKMRDNIAGIFKGLRESISKSYSELGTKMLGIWKMIGVNAVKGAAESEDMRARFNARYGTAQKGSPVFEALRGQALMNGKDVAKSLQSGLALTSVSKNTSDVLRMNEMVQRLSAFQPQGGDPAETAGLMKDAYFGKSEGLLQKLQIPASAAEQKKLESFSKNGDLNGFLQTFDALMTKANMSKASLELLMDSPIQKWEAAVNRFNGLLAAAGETALQVFAPVLDIINQAFQEGKFDPFFAGIQAGLTMLAGATAAVVNFLVENWNLVQNTLIVLGAIAAAMAVAWLVQWVIAAWPLFAIIGALVLIMTVLNEFGISTGTVVGAVVGIFAVLFAFISNSVAHAWNLLISFAEFFGNLLIDPAYACEKLIYDLVKTVSDYIGNLINSFGDAFNWIIEKVNDLTGSKFELIGKWSSDQIVPEKPESDKDVLDLSKYRMDQTNLTDAFLSGQKLVQDNLDFTKKLIPDTSGLAPGGKVDPWNGGAAEIPKVGEVGKVGAIGGEVDISDENLMMMRDLAEMDSIQNFVTLTPTVQVSTGDIHQGFDMDTLINRIGQKLEEEFVMTAEGVYG
ncbi:hypothetical protein [Paenibacillus apiarius]|uniref:hypothetical protein n=1 Tax=Paenibacillus apiarius TaxID=46240 RepID=UPI00197FA844|nr:hypothetical protein [Paenibacillus apiarius]MBN3523100.1 hypothetical protein [Paenibacillus apiarius]